LECFGLDITDALIKKKKKKKKKTQLWQPRKHERDRRENNINDRKNKKEMAKVFDIPARS
jgi:hypothetical protein